MRFGPYGEEGYKETWAGKNPKASKTILIGILVTFGLFSPYVTLFLFLSWWASPWLGLKIPKIFRYYVFCNVPANEACTYPRDERKDVLSSYFHTIETVTAIWFAGILTSFFYLVTYIFFVQLENNLSAFIISVLNEIHSEFEVMSQGSKTGPLFLLPALVGGFIAISGLLWWPMFAFFEWLEPSKKLKALKELAHA